MSDNTGEQFRNSEILDTTFKENISSFDKTFQNRNSSQVLLMQNT